MTELMNRIVQTNEYDDLIKKIKHKRDIVSILSIITILVTIAVCSPFHLVILNQTIIDYKGINPIITVLLVLLFFVIGIFANVLVSAPIFTSLDQECDPQKNLVLNATLSMQKNTDSIYAVDLIYMGKFEEALYYADRMIASNRSEEAITGLFNKARCEFFMGDYDSLKQTVKQYEDAVNTLKKVSQKTKDVNNKILKTMHLLVAIAEEDKESILIYSDIEKWNNSKVTEGYINYLKGIVAYISDNKFEAIYRFMYVKENCEKTVLSEKSQEYLSKLSTGI